LEDKEPQGSSDGQKTFEDLKFVPGDFLPTARSGIRAVHMLPLSRQVTYGLSLEWRMAARPMGCSQCRPLNRGPGSSLLPAGHNVPPYHIDLDPMYASARRQKRQDRIISSLDAATAFTVHVVHPLNLRARQHTSGPHITNNPTSLTAGRYCGGVISTAFLINW